MALYCSVYENGDNQIGIVRGDETGREDQADREHHDRRHDSCSILYGLGFRVMVYGLGVRVIFYGLGVSGNSKAPGGASSDARVEAEAAAADEEGVERHVPEEDDEQHRQPPRPRVRVEHLRARM